MQRSSESIGAIAAALAKAQAELSNPEKSLVATIRSRDLRDSERTFRYASLSSGLDIVRKSLGQHEIATVQTTQIDREAGLIRLTTMLAHSSGEWMSSEWPVCALADANAPQRMGAALTYARRYALFTLVGIAGEDDLDAPDLDAGSPKSAKSERAGPSRPSAEQAPLGAASTPEPRRKAFSAIPNTVLDPDASANCRDRLVGEIDTIVTSDGMAAWAYRVLPVKSTLRAEDAAFVEEAFRTKLTSLEPPSNRDDEVELDLGSALLRSEEGTARSADPHDTKPTLASTRDNGVGVEGPAAGNLQNPCVELPFGKTPRKRDKTHRLFVASKPCLVCGRAPADAHHVGFAQPRAMGRKVSDEFTVPLCRLHHRELHLRADESGWWREVKIDPLDVARRLWGESHGEAKPPGQRHSPS